MSGFVRWGKNLLREAAVMRSARPTARKRLVARTAAGAVLAAWAALATTSCSSFDLPLSANSDDRREFDKIEPVLDEEAAAYMEAVEYMEQLEAANPGATDIWWGHHSVCITDAAGYEGCVDTTETQRVLLEPLSRPSQVYVTGLHVQAKDPGRIFFVFNAPEPPVVYAMYAPDDDDPTGFAEERGFGLVRELGDGWTLLGSIRDREKSDAQWPRPAHPDYTWPLPTGPPDIV